MRVVKELQEMNVFTVLTDFYVRPRQSDLSQK